MMTSSEIGVVLLAPSSAVVVVQQISRYYRKVSQTVLRWYVELENGLIQADSGSVFDERVLNYRIDVELAMKPFDPREIKAVLLIHRDGLTHLTALRLAGINSNRPDKTVEDIETRLGKAFDKRRLSEFLAYIDYLR
jgi:hypothetical protein